MINRWHTIIVLTAWMTASVRYAGAQTGEIRGAVPDRATGEAMTGANVVVEPLFAGMTARRDGSYRICVGPGAYTVKVPFVACNTVALTGVTVREARPSK